MASRQEGLILEEWPNGTRYDHTSRGIRPTIRVVRTVPVEVTRNGETVITDRFGIEETGRVWCFRDDPGNDFPDMAIEEFGSGQSHRISGGMEESREYLEEFIRENRA